MPAGWDPLAQGGRGHARTDFVPKPRAQVQTQLHVMEQQQRETGAPFPSAEYSPAVADSQGPMSTPQLRYLLQQGALSRQQLHAMVQQGQVTPRQVQLALSGAQPVPSGYRAPPAHPAGMCI